MNVKLELSAIQDAQGGSQTHKTTNIILRSK